MQKALTVIARIKPEKAEDLEKLLDLIGSDIRGVRPGSNQNTYIDFSQLKSVHFMRWVMIPNDNTGKYEYLLMETNYDGTLADHVNEFVTQAGPAMDLIWGSCVGYPESRTSNPEHFKRAFRQFIEKHSIDYEAFYIGYRGESRSKVNRYIRIGRAFQALLDKAAAQGKLPDALKPVAGKLPAVRGMYETRNYTRSLFQWLAFVLDFIVHLPVIFIYRPVKNLVTGRERPLNLHLHDNGEKIRSGIADIEDAVTQNQLTVLSEIKPGWWPWLKVKVVLLFIQMFAKHIDNKGNLAGIATIHFARWVVIDRGRYLLFCSNYDGSWPSYIGDFVDKGASGMDLIWTSAPLYPAAGSRDLERFKHIIRRNQLRTQVFYSAYPDHTIKNILTDAYITKTLDEHGLSDRVENASL